MTNLLLIAILTISSFAHAGTMYDFASTEGDTIVGFQILPHDGLNVIGSKGQLATIPLALLKEKGMDPITFGQFLTKKNVVISCYRDPKATMNCTDFELYAK